MDLSNTRVPESFTIYRNFIHFRQPARPPPVRSEQLRPCRQKPKTQRVRRPARSGGGRAQGEPRCKPERGSRKCAWAMWRRGDCRGGRARRDGNRGATGTAGWCKKRGQDAAARRLSQGRARGVDRSAAAQGCRPFCKKAWRKTFQPAAAGKGSRHTGSSIGSAQCTRADCLFW